MICTGCSKAAEAAKDAGKHSHDPKVCYWPKGGCDCAHGKPIEQDPYGDPNIPDYIDALSPDDPRRLAYEAKQNRKIS